MAKLLLLIAIALSLALSVSVNAVRDNTKNQNDEDRRKIEVGSVGLYPGVMSVIAVIDCFTHDVTMFVVSSTVTGYYI